MAAKRFAQKNCSFALLLALFAGVSACFIAAAGIVQRRPAWEPAVFFAFQMLGVLLPGLAVFTFLRRDGTDGLTAIAVSWAAGYAVNVAAYFLLYVPGLQRFSRALFLLAAAASAAVLYLRREKLRGLTTSAPLTLGFFVLLLAWLAVTFVTIVLVYLTPDLTGASAYYVDASFWVDLSASAGRGFPVRWLQSLGMHMNYYYVSNFQIAWMHGVCGINYFTLTYAFSIFQVAALLVLGVYAAGRACSRRAPLVLGLMAAVLFTAGPESLSGVPIGSYRFYYNSGFFVCFALSFFVLFFLLQTAREEKIFSGPLLALVACFALAFGAYAVPALAAFSAAGMYCVIGAVRGPGRRRAQAFLCGTLLLGAACALYFGALRSQISNAASMEFPSFGMMYRTGLAAQFDLLWATPLRKLLTLPGIWLLWVFSWHPLAMGAAAAGLLALLFSRRMDHIAASLAGGIGIGIVLGSALQMWSNTQVRICVAVVPVAMVFAVYAADRMWDVLTARRGTRLTAGCLAAALFLTCGMYFAQYSARFFENGAASVQAVKTQTFKTYCPRSHTVFDKYQYAAMTWLRDNSPADALVLCDRTILGGDDARTLPYAMFSERQMYLEGPVYCHYEWHDTAEYVQRVAFIKALYGNEPDQVQKAKSLGIDYIIQTYACSPDFAWDPGQMERVYANEAIAIYRIL